MTAVPLRWRLADAPEESGQGSLFSSDDLMTTERGTGRLSGMEFLHVHARRIINEVPVRSRMPFRCTINAYRGCSHACTYCFARPTHDYLGLNIGEDFERRIVVKVTRWSGCGPSCAVRGGPARRSRWAPTPTRTNAARGNTG